MIHIHSLRDGLPLFKALGSETRIAILELLIEQGPMRMTKIAQELQITGGALTTHVRMLNEAGVSLTPGLDFGPYTAKNYIRVSYATSMENLREAVSRLQRFFGEG